MEGKVYYEKEGYIMEGRGILWKGGVYYEREGYIMEGKGILWKGRVYYEMEGYIMEGKCPRLYCGRGSVLDYVGEGEVS